jgi:hypothetical protein
VNQKQPSNFRAAAEAMIQSDAKLREVRERLAAKLLQARWIDRRDAKVDPKSKR